jgi:hypothetical protein
MTGTDCGLFTHKAVPVIFESPCIIRMIKSRRMRWAGHVARKGETTCVYKNFGWNLAQDGDQWRALVNTAMNLWVSEDARRFLSS